MKISVIGIGAIGGTLARKWAAAGHTIRVANSRGAEAAMSFAREIGAEAADLHGAVQGAEVIVLAIPFFAVADLPKGLLDQARADAVIIDVGNYYPDVRDPRIAAVDAGMIESVWVSGQLGRPVIKAFNSLMFHTLAELGRPRGSLDRLAVPVAGDSLSGKRVVMQLADEAGFDPVDAGTLEDSWRQQPSTPAYCCDYGAERTRQGLAAAVKGRAPGLRDTAWREGYMRIFADGPSFAEAHAAVIALNRSLNPLPA
jgi:predicted dinucleotide-binding enzyme